MVEYINEKYLWEKIHYILWLIYKISILSTKGDAKNIQKLFCSGGSLLKNIYLSYLKTHEKFQLKILKGRAFRTKS